MRLDFLYNYVIGPQTDFKMMLLFVWLPLYLHFASSTPWGNTHKDWHLTLNPKPGHAGVLIDEVAQATETSCTVPIVCRGAQQLASQLEKFSVRVEGLPRKPVTHNHNLHSANFLLLEVKVAHYYG